MLEPTFVLISDQLWGGSHRFRRRLASCFRALHPYRGWEKANGTPCRRFEPNAQPPPALACCRRSGRRRGRRDGAGLAVVWLERQGPPPPAPEDGPNGR